MQRPLSGVVDRPDQPTLHAMSAMPTRRLLTVTFALVLTACASTDKLGQSEGSAKTAASGKADVRSKAQQPKAANVPDRPAGNAPPLPPAFSAASAPPSPPAVSSATEALAEQTPTPAVLLIERAMENDVLCKQAATGDDLQGQARREGIIAGKGTYRKSSASTTHAVKKPLRFLGLPVSSLSFIEGSSPSAGAFWITLDASLKTTVAAVQRHGIVLAKDIRSGYLYASKIENRQRIEVHPAARQSMILCARTARK